MRDNDLVATTELGTFLVTIASQQRTLFNAPIYLYGGSIASRLYLTVCPVVQHDESSRRYDQQIEQKKKLATGVSSRHTSADQAPRVEAYKTKKWCTICSVEVSVTQTAHRHAVCMYTCTHTCICMQHAAAMSYPTYMYILRCFIVNTWF